MNSSTWGRSPTCSSGCCCGSSDGITAEICSGSGSCAGSLASGAASILASGSGSAAAGTSATVGVGVTGAFGSARACGASRCATRVRRIRTSGASRISPSIRSSLSLFSLAAKRWPPSSCLRRTSEPEILASTRMPASPSRRTDHGTDSAAIVPSNVMRP